MKQQLALGDFVFSLANKTAYEQLVRKSTGGWVNIDITNAKPRSHNTGQGLESITINGKVFGAEGMDALTAYANCRRPESLRPWLTALAATWAAGKSWISPRPRSASSMTARPW